MLNMGGPENTDDVGFFLNNLFMDKDLIPLPAQRYCIISVVQIYFMIRNSKFQTNGALSGNAVSMKRVEGQGMSKVLG